MGAEVSTQNKSVKSLRYADVNNRRSVPVNPVVLNSNGRKSRAGRFSLFVPRPSDVSKDDRDFYAKGLAETAKKESEAVTVVPVQEPIMAEPISFEDKIKARLEWLKQNDTTTRDERIQKRVKGTDPSLPVWLYQGMFVSDTHGALFLDRPVEGYFNFWFHENSSKLRAGVLGGIAGFWEFDKLAIYDWPYFEYEDYEAPWAGSLIEFQDGGADVIHFFVGTGSEPIVFKRIEYEYDWTYQF
ncbi:hypothetical protein HDU79_004627 [Rhizoclosmatium sp. JEL0117]|nr:hypothetical protein HDU79_004627 [Rhizoclosmatium sp. JEL0117]